DEGGDEDRLHVRGNAGGFACSGVSAANRKKHQQQQKRKTRTAKKHALGVCHRWGRRLPRIWPGTLTYQRHWILPVGRVTASAAAQSIAVMAASLRLSEAIQSQSPFSWAG